MINRIYRLMKIYGYLYTLKYSMYGFLLLYHRMVGRKYIRRRIYNFNMLLLAKDVGISQDLYLYGERELQLKCILETLIEPGYRILDLGANLGYYPLVEYQILEGRGKIYAFEPSPQNYKVFKMNIELNEANCLIDAYPLAGGEKPGKEKFYLSTHSNINTMIPIEYTTGKPSHGISDNYIEVTVLDLSSFIRRKGKIDLIRMDIEGYEVEVLKGLKSAIEDNSFTGTIVFECHSPKYDENNHSIRQQLRMLFENGYSARYMTSNREKNSSFHKLGYRPNRVIRTSVDNVQGVYEDVGNRDAEYLICDGLGVRDVIFDKNA